MNRFFSIFVNLFLCVLLISILNCDSNPASSNTDEQGWISFQLDGVYHKFEKGLYLDMAPDISFYSKEAYAYFLPTNYLGSGVDAQYVFMAFQILVTDPQQAKNGINFAYINDYDDVWKFSLEYFDENGVASQTQNKKLNMIPIDTTVAAGERLFGEINGSYELSPSGKTVSNITYSLIRIK